LSRHFEHMAIPWNKSGANHVGSQDLRCNAAELICYSICEHRSKTGRNTKGGNLIHINVCTKKTSEQMFYLWYARPMIEHAFACRYMLGCIISIFCSKIYHLGVNMVMAANIFTFLSWCPDILLWLAGTYRDTI
jgi:hypothetical protein